MSHVGIRALKQNASAVVARAAAGEVVIVTDRGRPVAQLTPIPNSDLDGLLAAGLARPPRRPLADLPEPVAGDGQRLSDDVIAVREHERY